MKLAPELTVTIPIEADGSFDRPEFGLSLTGADTDPAVKAVESAIVSVVMKQPEVQAVVEAVEADLNFHLKKET